MLSFGQFKSQYTLKELSELDSIPFEKVKQLDIDCRNIKAEWFSIIQNLTQVRQILVSCSDENAFKLYDNELRLAMGNLDSLKTISLSFDSLETIPPFFVNADQINTLSISGAYLGEMPETVKKLKNLDWLLFSVKTCNKFPLDLSELKNLKTVNFRSENLKIFPQFIGTLENLDEFAFSSNVIQVIPNIWKNLHNLRLIDFYCPNLQIMEGSMVELVNLYGIHFNKAFNLINLPDSLGSLPKLISVNIEAAWRLKHIGNLSESKSLEYLAFDSKNLKFFLKDIRELSDELLFLHIGVFEAMELKKSKLSKLKAIKEIGLISTYYIEKGTQDTVYYYDQIFGHRPLATEEQKEKLTRLYKILPQVVKLNF